MYTIAVLLKNFFKGVATGVPLWGVGIIANLILHQMDVGAIIYLMAVSGLFAGEIFWNLVSLINIELIHAIKLDIRAIKARKAVKAAAEEEAEEDSADAEQAS